MSGWNSFEAQHPWVHPFEAISAHRWHLDRGVAVKLPALSLVTATYVTRIEVTDGSVVSVLKFSPRAGRIMLG